MKKKAFTLAEVLITLTIIGVIAAITIPNLIQSYKKHEVEVAVKEAYSILSNAIKMSEAENGSANEWNYARLNTDLSLNKIFPYLKISKITQNMTVHGLNGQKYLYNSWIKSAILDNGMQVGVMPHENMGAHFFVDINGPNKGPSQLGIDIFLFSLLNDKGWQGTRIPGILYTGPMLNGRTTSNCSIHIETNNNEPNGMKCSSVIQQNGWKIPDDYPIKKF